MEQRRLAAPRGAEDAEGGAPARELELEGEIGEAVGERDLEHQALRLRAESQNEASNAARARTTLTATSRIAAVSPSRTLRSV